MNAKKLIALVIVLSFIVIGFFPLNAMIRDDERVLMEEQYKKITFEQMEDLIKDMDEYYILDVRTLAEYVLEHYEGAILHQLQIIEKVDLPKDAPIFIYCRSGNRSKEAALYLLKNDYINVYDVGAMYDDNRNLKY